MRKSSLTIIILIAAITAVRAQKPDIDGSKIIINLAETNF